MNPRPDLGRSQILTKIIAGLLSAFFAIGGLSAVAWLFLRDKTPYEQVLAADRACTNDAPVSERDACRRPDAEGSHVSRVASH